MEKLQDIRDLLPDEISDAIKLLGEKPFRAKQIYEWLWKKNAHSFDDMSNLPKSLRDKLSLKFSLSKAVVKEKQVSKDKTIKIAFELQDQRIVEGVLIPTENRTTACISSQVGCKLGCKFCATATLGFVRNLSAAEIYDQVVEIHNLSLEKYNLKLTNIVLMGMGEPLLNYDNVTKAIDMITSEQGLGMSPQRITLSTVGIPKMIMKMADDNIKYNLAVSLHSAENKIRDSIIPVNKRNDLHALKESLIYFNEKTGSRITFEYLLMKGVNDSIKDAQALAEYCKSFPVKINIIEFNPISNKAFQRSEHRDFDEFASFLQSKNMIVNIRRSRGKDIDAACGQLAGKKN